MLTLQISVEDFGRLPLEAQQAIELYAENGRRIDRRSGSEYVFRLPECRWREVQALCGEFAGKPVKEIQ